MPLMAWIAMCGLFITVSVQAAAFAYFLGRLSERVTTLEREAKRDAGTVEAAIRLDEQMKGVKETLDKLGREMAGMHRAMANMTRSGPPLREFTVEG